MEQNNSTVLHTGNYHFTIQSIASNDQDKQFDYFYELFSKENLTVLIVRAKAILQKFKNNKLLQEKTDQEILVDFIQKSYKIDSDHRNNCIDMSSLSLIRAQERQRIIDYSEISINFKNMDNQNFQKFLDCFEIKDFIRTQLRWNFPNAIKFKQLFKRFIEIFQSKICSFSEWKCVYGDFQPLLKRLSVKISQIKPLPGEPLFEDLLFHHFIQIYKTRNKGKGYYYENKPLSVLFNSTDLFYSSDPQWHEAYLIVRASMSAQDSYLFHLKDTKAGYNEFTHNVIADQREYLCCVRYLRPNKSMDTQSKFGLLQFIKNNKDSLEVKRKLCGLLNNTQGGTILFDQAEDYYMPKGYHMSKEQRQTFEKYITNLASQLCPEPRKSEFKLDFIFIQNGTNDIVVPRLNVKSSSQEIDAFSIYDGKDWSCYLRRSTLFGQQTIKIKCSSSRSIQKLVNIINDFVLLNGEKICSSCDENHRCSNLVRRY